MSIQERVSTMSNDALVDYLAFIAARIEREGWTSDREIRLQLATK